MLTVGLAKATKRVDSVGDEVPEPSKGLSVDHDRFVHALTCEDLIVFAEEVVGPSCDLRRRNVARKVLQLLDASGKSVDVFVQSVGLETAKDLGTEAF